MLATLFVKLSSLTSQLVLGYQLTLENFSNYATALGVVSFVAWLKNGAIMQIAIKRGVESLDEKKLERHAAFFNLYTGGVLLLLGCIYLSINVVIAKIIFAYSISQFFSLSGFKNRVSLIVKGGFGKLAIYEAAVGIINSAVIILFSTLYGNEICFVAAIFAVLIFEVLYYVKLNRFSTLFKGEFDLSVWRDGRWLLLSCLGNILVMQTAFFVVSILYDVEVSGLYYFAFQLIGALALVVSEAIKKVLLPYFVTMKVNDDESYIKVIGLFSVFFIPMSFAIYFSVACMVQMIWGDKWLGASRFAEILSISLFIPLLTSVSYSFMESQGKWKERSVLQLGDGIISIALIALGSFYGDLIAVGIALIIRRFSFGIYQIVYPVKDDVKLVFKILKTLFFCFLTTLLVCLVVNVALDFILDEMLLHNLLSSILVFFISALMLLKVRKYNGLR